MQARQAQPQSLPIRVTGQSTWCSTTLWRCASRLCIGLNCGFVFGCSLHAHAASLACNRTTWQLGSTAGAAVPAAGWISTVVDMGRAVWVAAIARLRCTQMHLLCMEFMLAGAAAAAGQQSRLAASAGRSTSVHWSVRHLLHLAHMLWGQQAACSEGCVGVLQQMLHAMHRCLGGRGQSVAAHLHRKGQQLLPDARMWAAATRSCLLLPSQQQSSSSTIETRPAAAVAVPAALQLLSLNVNHKTSVHQGERAAPAAACEANV